MHFRPFRTVGVVIKYAEMQQSFPSEWNELNTFEWKIVEHSFLIRPFLSLLSYMVAELKARITGPVEVFVKSGSEITLTCKLQQNPHDLGTIFWKKGE